MTCYNQRRKIPLAYQLIYVWFVRWARNDEKIRIEDTKTILGRYFKVPRELKSRMLNDMQSYKLLKVENRFVYFLGRKEDMQEVFV